MPLSTWRSAAIVGDALFVEDVGLGPELQRRVRQPEALGQVAHRDEHGPRMRVLAPIDRRGGHLIIGQQLDDAIGAAGRVCNEDDGLARLPRVAELRHPVGYPPRKLHRGLRADVPDLILHSERKRLDRRRRVEDRRHIIPADDQRRRIRHALVLANRLGVARLDVPALTDDRGAHLVRLGHEHDRMRIGQVVEDCG